MIKQTAYVLGRSVAIAILGFSAGVMLHSTAFSNAFDYGMTKEEQRKVVVVSGDLILGGAVITGVVSGLLSLAAGGLELAYLYYRSKEASEKLAKSKDEAIARLKSHLPLTDDEIIWNEALARGAQPTDKTATT